MRKTTDQVKRFIERFRGVPLFGPVVSAWEDLLADGEELTEEDFVTTGCQAAKDMNVLLSDLLDVATMVNQYVLSSPTDRIAQAIAEATGIAYPVARTIAVFAVNMAEVSQ